MPASPQSDRGLVSVHRPVPGIDDAAVDVTYVIRVLRQRIRWVAGGAVAAALLVLLMALLGKRTYSSSAAIVPQGRSAPSGIAAIATQLGLGSLSGDGSQNSAFYIELLGSRSTLREVAATSFPVSTDAKRPRPLADVLEISGATPALRTERTADYLAQRVALSGSPKTGVIRISVSVPDPLLAQGIANRFVSLADQFNLARRQSQAGAERRFVEKRLSDVRDSLRDAEARLQNFLQVNRDFRAPSLELAHTRLERDVVREQQLFSTLQNAYEQARIEEVRDTPVLTVVEPPVLPVRPDPRGLGIKLLVALIIGAVLGLLAGHGLALYRAGHFGNERGLA